MLPKLKFVKLGFFGRDNDGSSDISFRTLSVKVEGPEDALRLKLVKPSAKNALVAADRCCRAWPGLQGDGNASDGCVSWAAGLESC
jgi:hypothetical protein